MPARLLNYHRQGSGSPLVLVHGVAGSWQHWLPVIDELSEHHDVIAVDLAGFGGSTALGIAQPTIPAFADDILALLDHLGIDRFHVSGNSLGGAVTMELLRSGRVLSYSGISAAGQTYGWYIEITRWSLRFAYYGSRLVHPVAKLLVRSKLARWAFMWQIVGKPGKLTPDLTYEMIHACAIGRGFEATIGNAIPKHGLVVPENDVPAQMLWGTKDWILPLSAVARWRDAWPELHIVAMDGLGHVPMQDDPEQITRHILRLTQQVDASASTPTQAA
ncbi:MAG: alpha/beta fold hydrolase [Patulibacter minatonensis]